MRKRTARSRVRQNKASSRRDRSQGEKRYDDDAELTASSSLNGSGSFDNPAEEVGDDE
jgi:hypothetical protein